MEENEKNIPATPVPEAENGVTTEVPSVEAPAAPPRLLLQPPLRLPPLPPMRQNKRLLRRLPRPKHRLAPLRVPQRPSLSRNPQ